MKSIHKFLVAGLAVTGLIGASTHDWTPAHAVSCAHHVERIAHHSKRHNAGWSAYHGVSGARQCSKIVKH